MAIGSRIALCASVLVVGLACSQETTAPDGGRGPAAPASAPAPAPSAPAGLAKPPAAPADLDLGRLLAL